MKVSLVDSPSPERSAVITPSERLENSEHIKQLLLEIVQAGLKRTDLQTFLSEVSDLIGSVFRIENFSVLLKDALTGQVRFEFWKDEREPMPEPDKAIRSLSGAVISTGECLLKAGDECCGQDAGDGPAWTSWAGVPLIASGRAIGALALHSYDPRATFDHIDLEFLRAVGEQVTAVIERRRADRALRESESRYRMLFDHAPDGIVISDERGGIRDVNESFCRLLGYLREELLHLNTAQVLHGDDLPFVEFALREIADREEYHREWRFLRKDGAVVSAEVSSKRMPDGRVLSLVRDLSERRRTELALKRSEERFRELVENATDIIYVHDLEGNYTSVNRAAERVTGYHRSEILKMNMRAIVAPEYLDKVDEMLASKLAGNQATAYEVEAVSKDGRRIWLEVNSRLMFENGKPVAVQGIARDVTERKLLEEKFRQSQKLEAIGLLAGGISHDFNNLLTAISGYSEITLAKMADDDPLRGNIQEIREIGERASALTRQLLAFSRKQKLSPQVHNLNSVIRGVERMLRRIVRENIEFKFELDPELQQIEADPGQLEQVIINLVINAQDAMPHGGRLTIATSNCVLDGVDDGDVKLGAGPYVKAAVSDTGEGIDEKILGRIFEPFFTTKSPGKGSGLGLSTVHGIVKQSGGDITVTSSPGEGTTFEIYLPAASREAEEPTSAAPDKTMAGGRETVLLVEDDRSVRKLVKEILSHNGYRVLEAEDAELALDICGKTAEPIHVLLTDLVMPKMNGVELSCQVAQIHPEAKPIVMTGYGSEIPENACAGAAAFIQKPFTPDSLVTVLRKVLES